VRVCNMYVCMSVCCHDKRKTPDWNDLKLGTVVILDIEAWRLWVQKVKAQGHHSIMEILGPLNIIGTVKDRHFLFGLHIVYTTSTGHRMTNYLLK